MPSHSFALRRRLSVLLLAAAASTASAAEPVHARRSPSERQAFLERFARA